LLCDELKESVNVASGLKPERLESDSVSILRSDVGTGMFSLGFGEMTTDA